MYKEGKMVADYKGSLSKEGILKAYHLWVLLEFAVNKFVWMFFSEQSTRVLPMHKQACV